MNQHAAALQYAHFHWSVIPVRAHEKRPAIRWMEYQQRFATDDEINEWFTKWPDSNVAIVTGSLSGIVVLDIDPRHAGDKSLNQWEQQHRPLPRTLEVKTGGGGRHLYFKHPGGLVRNRVGLAPGVDFRGDGGCIVVPPSIHPSGNVYRWLKGHGPDDLPVADLPKWLLKIIAGKNPTSSHTIQYWQQLIREGVPKGERNNTIASLAGHLLWHGVDADVVQELLLCWNQLRCQPPLNETEVIRTVQSITRLHETQEQ